MNILHISPYAFRGGCEKDCYLFIKASPTFNHEIIVLGLEGPMTLDWENQGVPVRHLNILVKSIFEFKSKLQYLVQGKSYDMVINWSSVRLSAVLGAIKKATQQVRVHIGNPSQYTPIQLYKEKILELAWGRPQNVILMHCSKYAQKSFEKLLYFRSFPSKVALNPIELPLKRMEHAFFSQAQIHVGMVARLDPIKNHELLLKAFAQVSLYFPDMILHLLGDGILKKDLLKLRSVLKLNKKVIFHGDVKDVYRHLEAWDAFIYSTTLREGLGCSVMEAMANGLPCLLPDLPMIREIVDEKAWVKWFKADSIEDFICQWVDLFRNRDRFEGMSRSVYLRSLHFRPQLYVEAYLTAL